MRIELKRRRQVYKITSMRIELKRRRQVYKIIINESRTKEKETGI